MDHVPLPPGLPPGAEGFKLFFGGLRAAFPDFHYTIDETIAEGEKVVGVARLAEKEEEEDGNVILLTDPVEEE